MKQSELKHVYNSGLGQIAFGICRTEKEEIGLTICDLVTDKTPNIGDVCAHEETNNHTVIFFHSLEGLAVLEEIIEKIKEQLKQTL